MKLIITLVCLREEREEHCAGCKEGSAAALHLRYHDVILQMWLTTRTEMSSNEGVVDSAPAGRKNCSRIMFIICLAVRSPSQVMSSC